MFSRCNSTSGISFLSGVSVITDGLLLSSASALIDNVLQKFNITCVINAAAELPDSPVDKEIITYYKIPVLDASHIDLSLYFNQVSDIIHNVSIFCTLFLFNVGWII